MKTTNWLTLIIFLASFLVGGIALAKDSSAFDSVTSDSSLGAPELMMTITGTRVSLSWSKVTGATGYQVCYTQYPYDNPEAIKTIDVGDNISAVYELSPGCAYLVAVKACDSSGFNCSDYSVIHDVVIPLVSTFKNSLGQTFKLIPAGTFTMGSPTGEPGRFDDETQHTVTLTKSFYMQTTEVTQGQWKKLMGSNPSSFTTCGEDCPVEKVSWDDAQAYIAKLNQRGEGIYALPTEAQWEYAARAGSTTAFYNGGITSYPDMYDCNYDGNPNAIAWYCYNSDLETHPVAQKTPNAWGLFDMSGNVSEWCSDWYGDYPSGSVTDPTGPQTGIGRVQRGGNWGSAARRCRSASRLGGGPDDRYSYLGFRLARAQ